MSILKHPKDPGNPNLVLLADFLTGGWKLKRDHMDWLNGHAVPVLNRTHPGWVTIRGFASKLGGSAANMRLSNLRAESVATYLMSYPTTKAEQIAIDSRGEEWATGADSDNSPQWRSVAVQITPSPPIGVVPKRVPKLEMIERIVKLHWIGRATSKSGRPDTFPGDPGGGLYFGGFLRDVGLLAKAPHRIVKRRFPISHRVNSITVISVYSGVSYDTTVTYEWGRPSAKVTLRERGSISEISREGARWWIEDPATMIFSFGAADRPDLR